MMQDEPCAFPACRKASEGHPRQLRQAIYCLCDDAVRRMEGYAPVIIRTPWLQCTDTTNTSRPDRERDWAACHQSAAGL